MYYYNTIISKNERNGQKRFVEIICQIFFYAGSKVFEANPDTKRLYDDLLSNYNRLIRPVINNTETLTVWLGLKLSQLIEMVYRLM